MSDDTFSGLKFVIQYRRRDFGHGWKTMAAFDLEGPAEKYFDEQRYDEDWPWVYRLLDIETNSITERCPVSPADRKSET